MPEASKSSRDILKLVDQLVKSNNLEKALQEVQKARQLDPKNLYAFAYEERIQELFAKQHVIKDGTDKNLKNTGTSVKEPLKHYDLSEQVIQEGTRERDVQIPALYEEFKKAGLRSTEQIKNAKVKKASDEALELYKQALLLVWSDGQKTEEEARELQDLRQSLYISSEEHEQLDKQAKLECYILLLKHLLQSPGSKSELAGRLAELRKSFDVSSSEQVLIEANMASLDTKGGKRTIVVVDDDKQMLTMMTEILAQEKYTVKDFNTSDNAYEYLKNGKTDLILCDISLDTSTMNGFLFYEKIRELRHLQQVPFVFITGLNDIVLIRAGKEMGVDDFLIKPIRRENLLATIRGRIKRYEQMKLMSGL